MKITIVLLLLLASRAFAHGGEDHGAAASHVATPVASGSQLKLVSYPGTLEVLVKYPAPVLDKPVVGRLFFADYASNHPVDPTGIELSFPGALAAKVTKQPTKVSDGVYAFEAVFVRDTNHTALLKYTYADAEQLASLSPFFAGTSATRQLTAAHTTAVKDEGYSFPGWLLIPIALGLGVLAYVLFRRRRKVLLVAKSQGTTTVVETKTPTV
jgi:hypothetical protein